MGKKHERNDSNDGLVVKIVRNLNVFLRMYHHFLAFTKKTNFGLVTVISLKINRNKKRWGRNTSETIPTMVWSLKS